MSKYGGLSLVTHYLKLMTALSSWFSCAGAFLLIFSVSATGADMPPAAKPGAVPVRPLSEVGGAYHVVEKGQTLWRIARAYGVDLEALQWINDIDDVAKIAAGRRLFIPGATAAMKVEPYRPGEPQAPLPQPITLAWPLIARLSSGFGPRSGAAHQGVDLPSPAGTAIHAAADGKVVYSGEALRGYGKVVVVKHGEDFSTVYAHNSANLVKMGDVVSRGQVIARVGRTGRATGTHLHFEVRLRGVAQNPLIFLARE